MAAKNATNWPAIINVDAVCRRSAIAVNRSWARLTRHWDPVQAAGGVAFFMILGVSAWCEWLAISWLLRQF
ncbi:MAG: hypothetical protein DCC67_16875 [Planctomycetota bacterium]|nr:MAG: hypothetical protein DCC67_16875 [Planctomycetota bacterium]